jgi:hypothetical protein
VARLEGFDIVCVSVMDWEHPFASSRHHLMKELATRNRVLFVDNQVNPLTAVRGAGHPRMRRKLGCWAGLAANPREVSPNLWVYTPPPVVPMGRLTDRRMFDAAYAFNQARLRTGVQQACTALGMSRPLLWISFNVLSSESLIGALNEQLVVYHCTDEITAMVGNSPFVGEIERRLLAKAHLAFCSSRTLAADKGPFCREAHFVPNGADTALFETARDPATIPHPQLAAFAGRGPVFGFAGHIEERFDFALIETLAQATPGWCFALAGPVAASRQAEAERLGRLPNVKLLGLLPRPELPAFLKACDVGLIPFVHSAQTRAIYPLKLNEYLAAGKPVALTPFADLREFEGLIHVGDGPAGFAQACRAALADGGAGRERQRVAIARANTWEARAAQVEALVCKALDRRDALPRPA